MMQAFRSSSVMARCRGKFEIADTLAPAYCPSQAPMSEVNPCRVQHGKRFTSRMRSDKPKRSPVVRSDATDYRRVLVELNTTTTTAVRSSGKDCHHRNHEEERESRPLSRSILYCNSSTSAAAADVPCNTFPLEGCNLGRRRDTRPKNLSASSIAFPEKEFSEIECYSEADVLAACSLMEISTSSHSSGAFAGEKHSPKQLCSRIRVSVVSDHAPASPPVRELLELAGAKPSGRLCVTDGEVVGIAQETRATCEATCSGTPRSLRVKLKTPAKTRIKPRKNERELNIFGMKQELLIHAKMYDRLDKPTRKRPHKSLRVLLEM